MKPRPFRSLLDDAACRAEMLAAVGQQLRVRYAEQGVDAMPERMRELLARLMEAERPAGSCR